MDIIFASNKDMPVNDLKDVFAKAYLMINDSPETIGILYDKEDTNAGWHIVRTKNYVRVTYDKSKDKRYEK